MTSDRFAELAETIAGRHWRVRLGPMIDRSRTQVWEYATGRSAVDGTVAKLMEALASAKH
ncbi:hypothetical protein [Tautonia marina]|uniref:hypothetical protein n=1 Tax=Tautonia marina TaxID=2653855 RepID=UPI0012613452|nr:hypothetical protein [Tautonia marina]